MKIYFLEPIGVNIQNYIHDFVDHEVINIDTRNMGDDELIGNISDADVVCLTNRPLSARVITSYVNVSNLIYQI
jgi:hypothetical protein